MSELLSPAGNKESFYAAISNGANAIYLGLDKFSARAYANNFSIEDLKELIVFAHLRNVKIYVTINTIVFDNELNDVFETIDRLADIGIDAIIVQDLAVLSYITNHYSSIQAHASTQMGIDDIFGAQFIKNLNATRIVFARETDLETIKNIKEKLNIEVEAFIHGALCVSYSGNCLMSSMIGERSGNRGRCAGCCRKLYSLIDLSSKKTVKTGYLLSMKDLNTSDFISEMLFIDSFKIEGRMKEPSYVAAVTKIYRGLIDKTSDNKEDLQKVFNRTYTKGYILSESNTNISNYEKPNNYGFLIGEVIKQYKNKIWIKLSKPLNKGDQIRVETDKLNEEISIPVLKMFDNNLYEITSSSDIAVTFCDKYIKYGSKVYKTKDSEFIKNTNQCLINKEFKKIPLEINVEAHLNQPLSVTVKYLNFEIKECSNSLIEKAISAPTTKDNILRQISKLNDTPYVISKLNIDMDDNVFIPLKQINELRRIAIINLDKERLSFSKITITNKPIIVQKYTQNYIDIAVEVSTFEQYKVAKNLGIKIIYYKNKVDRNFSVFPNKIDENYILVGGLNGIEYYKDKKIDIVTDYSLNISNYLSVALLSSLSVARITLSQEISKNNIKKLISNYRNEFKTDPSLELIVYGRTKLMYSKYCVLKRLGMCGLCKKNHYQLKDEYESFPLVFNANCTTTLLNSKIFNIMDEVSDIDGISVFRLVFTTENEIETAKIINNFKDILSNKKPEKIYNNNLYTRGHFFKNPL